MTLKILGMLVLSILSGWSDSQGFLHANKIWSNNHIVLGEMLKSAIGFSFGVLIYWITLLLLSDIKEVSVEVQTLGWFGATMIGVAVVSGSFMKWGFIDQLIGFLVFVGILWLLFHTGG